VPRKALKPRERRKVEKPDYKYNSLLVARFIGKLNFRGKKTIGEDIFYSALDRIQEKMKEEPLAVFTRAIENTRPLLEVRPRRVGGATYQVPSEVRPERGEALAMKWILGASRAKRGRPMHERLSDELMAASKKEGESIKKREDTHKMAEANKAFAHYRW